MVGMSPALDPLTMKQHGGFCTAHVITQRCSLQKLDRRSSQSKHGERARNDKEKAWENAKRKTRQAVETLRKREPSTERSYQSARNGRTSPINGKRRWRLQNEQRDTTTSRKTYTRGEDWG